MARTLGYIRRTQANSLVCQIEWREDNVQSVLQQYDDACDSPTFEFCGGHWTLKMIRSVETTMIQCLCIYIQRHSTSCHKNHVEYKLIKINSDGAEHLLIENKTEAEKNIWDDLVVFDLYGRNFSWSEETVFDLKVDCTIECFECKSESQEHISNVRRETGELLIGCEDHDLRIKVKDRVFPAHKSIVRARCPVFHEMLRHDMVERRTGEINITGCEPLAFKRFLDYLSYSSELEIDSMAIVYSIYPITVKYEDLRAKEKCVKYMSENLAVETFWDIVTLSLRHEELKLLECAKQFFVDNSKAIMQTHRWLTFVKENPTAANDFLKKIGSSISLQNKEGTRVLRRRR